MPKKKVRKIFKGKHIVDDDTSGRLIRIVTDTLLPDAEVDKRIDKIKKEKK